jgi:hypothetical protein
MFSRWIVTNITFARGNLHCRKTRILYGAQLVICGLYATFGSTVTARSEGTDAADRQTVLATPSASMCCVAQGGHQFECLLQYVTV